uniref:6-pyruvoyl tetrahydrobiopterin synthase n=1 Tax=Panagrellus redivivus TaxID=6233 RepID=A0A7E4ZQV9_PANRE
MMVTATSFHSTDRRQNKPALPPYCFTMSDGVFYYKDVPIAEMTRIESFSASHRLHNPELTDARNVEMFGKCNNPNGHGHNYKWEVTLRGPVKPTSGMVYDLADLKQEMGFVLSIVDHKNLDLDVPYFREGKHVSTTENLAVFLYDTLKANMGQPQMLKKVKLWETDKNVFTYKGVHTPE